MASEEGQQHPLKIYWIMWGALFVLSAFSYATDFMQDGTVRTSLILLFMMLKAGGIVWIFMHMGLALAAQADPTNPELLLHALREQGSDAEPARRRALEQLAAATPDANEARRARLELSTLLCDGPPEIRDRETRARL